MGGLLHLFDFHNNTFSKKSNLNPKIHDEDLEAPRNSFELLQADNFHTYEDKTKSYEFEEEEEWYERGCYPIEESMRKKIINELSKHSNQTTPSLVAKLMGMDSLPLHSPKSTNWTNPQTKSNQKIKNSTKQSTKKLKKEKLSSSSMESEEKPSPLQIRREHPQEEELQRFRREFEAWQSNKTSKIAEESQKKNLFTRTRSFGRDFDKNSPTKIVILRPGPQKVYDFEDSLTTSSATTMEESSVSKVSIEEFLEEVKERLKGEIQGKQLIQRSSSVRGSGIETPFSERPSPKSEFIRSYTASEIQCNSLDSPEFISKDTRKLLAERLRNVLRQEISPQEDLKTRTSTRLRSSVSSDVESLRKLTDDQLNRSGLKKESSLSSRNLKRSLSAPVSGTSFGKLLLEDRHVLTGAKIIRKHEEAMTEEEEEEVSVVIDPIRRKERFNLRKKVSSFRSSLRGRIFGKKIRSMIESNSFEDESIKDFVTGSRFNGFYDRNENSTEVPPSPASVCSSTPDEYWRNIDYLSPISTPDVTVTDENGMPQVFRDISSNLSELRRQINELESDVRTPMEQEANQEIEIIDLANPDKVFVRDLLVASGLYDGTLDRSMSRWDPLAKPINKSVLQETKHKRINQEFDENEEEEEEAEEEEEEEDHNMLFDLLNEALAMVLGPLNKKNLVNIKGKNLLESTWKIMSEYLYVQTTEKPFCSLDGIIGWDLEKFPWSCLISEEVNGLGKEIEGLIMVDLVEEIVKDLRT